MAGMCAPGLWVPNADCIVRARCEAVVFLPSLTACPQPLFPSGSIAGAPRRLTIPGPYGPGFIWNELHLPLIPAKAGIQNDHFVKDLGPRLGRTDRTGALIVNSDRGPSL